MKYRQLAIAHPDDLLFGHAPKPVATRHGLRIGGGVVYPELNFTLPPIEVTAATMPIVTRHYHDIITDALRRAAELEAPGVVIEFETLPPMTATPAFGLEIARILLAGMEQAHRTHGLKSVLRMTPNDNREFARPRPRPPICGAYRISSSICLRSRITRRRSWRAASRRRLNSPARRSPGG